jgi:ABC-type phosphate transport system substrate-binding protein
MSPFSRWSRRLRPVGAAVALVLVAQTPLLAQGFRVIAHESVTASELPAATIAGLFMKQATKFPDGGAAVPVDQPIASPARGAFSTRVLGRRPAAVEQFWQQQIFSGGGTPPSQKPGDDAVVAFVKSTKGAIGYIGGDGPAPAGTKVIAVK